MKKELLIASALTASLGMVNVAEAAANVLTNPQLDPYGKIPEFKFSAASVLKTQSTTHQTI